MDEMPFGASNARGRFRILEETLQRLGPDIVYVSSQADPDLVRVIETSKQLACDLEDRTAAENASVYQWPAASANGECDNVTNDASELVHLKSSRIWNFPQVHNVQVKLQSDKSGWAHRYAVCICRRFQAYLMP
jgi:hypothetical protein